MDIARETGDPEITKLVERYQRSVPRCYEEANATKVCAIPNDSGAKQLSI